MAVTYAWRLDANKFAYLYDPDKKKYGLATNTPLTSDKLAIVAEVCNDRFGKDGDEGIEGYRVAFNAMTDEIKNRVDWENVEYYDLLSADVYYNVDSSYCADLRGVGIQGIKFLGVADSYDSNNAYWETFDPSAKEGDRFKIAGKFSIYGIYMDDMPYEKDNGIKLPPERIFAVYNGKDGSDTIAGPSTEVLGNMILEETENRKKADEVIETRLDELEQPINLLNNLIKRFGEGGLTSILELIMSMESTINELQGEIDNLTNRLNKVEGDQAIIDNLKEGETTNNNSGGSISFDDYNGQDVYLIGVDKTEDICYKLPLATYKDGNVTAKGFYQSQRTIIKPLK